MIYDTFAYFNESAVFAADDVDNNIMLRSWLGEGVLGGIES
jgi:hypothetical protein